MQDPSPGRWPSGLALFSSALGHHNPGGALRMLLNPHASTNKSTGHQRTLSGILKLIRIFSNCIH